MYPKRKSSLLCYIRSYTENWRDPGLNPTRLSARLWVLCFTRLPVTFGLNQESNTVINIGVVRLYPWQWGSETHGTAKWQLKKMKKAIDIDPDFQFPKQGLILFTIIRWIKQWDVVTYLYLEWPWTEKLPLG